LSNDGSLVNNETQTNNEDLGILDSFVDKIKQALSSLGLVVENGVAKVKEMVAEKITAKKAVLDKIELRDEKTQNIYCVKVVDGVLVNISGECDQVNNQPSIEEEKEITQVEPVVPVESVPSE
ncbi:hypothetical protein KKC67_02730, partial [Patescibacteria group bacterium]|nr:hypothetical protein [Patescibacteria group bacterium]MBU1991897.1 hypothetical protein [Patescibacteria group bacterium]